METERNSSKYKFDYNAIGGEIFEPQFVELGLSKEQIDKQKTDELIDSLEIINDCISNSEKFGILNVEISARGPIITYNESKSHIKITALSILLSRKKRILKRLNSLKPKSLNNKNNISNNTDKFKIIKLTKELIAKGEIQAAIEQLNSNIDVEDELVRLSSSLSFHTKDDRNGILDRDSLNLERSRITNSLLAIIRNWKNK